MESSRGAGCKRKDPLPFNPSFNGENKMRECGVGGHQAFGPWERKDGTRVKDDDLRRERDGILGYHHNIRCVSKQQCGKIGGDRLIATLMC